MSCSTLKHNVAAAGMVIMAVFLAAAACALVMRVRTVINTQRVQWISADPLANYPEPVCDICGKIEDGRCQCGGVSTLGALTD